MSETHRQREENAPLTCPRCQFKGMRRVRRQGWWERELLPRLGYYPWECVDCRHISMFKMRKAPGSSRQPSTGVSEPGLDAINQGQIIKGSDVVQGAVERQSSPEAKQSIK